MFWEGEFGPDTEFSWNCSTAKSLNPSLENFSWSSVGLSWNLWWKNGNNDPKKKKIKNGKSQAWAGSKKEETKIPEVFSRWKELIQVFAINLINN